MFFVLVLLAIVAISRFTASGHRVTTQPQRTSSKRLTTSRAYAAVAWTILASTALLVLPAYSGTQWSSSDNGSVVVTTRHQTLLAKEGRSIIAVLALPVTLAVVGALGWPRCKRRLRIGTGALLTIGCFVSAASIGIFYMPAAAALLAAGLGTRGDR